MKKEKLQRLHFIYSILNGIVSVLAGVCLIAACLGIYYGGGDEPYSRQAVSEAFRPIAPAVYACLALVIGGLVLDAAVPSSQKRQKPEKNHDFILRQLQAKADLSAGNEELLIQIEKQRKSRRLHRLIRGIIIAFSSIVFLIYALDGSHYHQTQINDSMIRAMWVLLPCFAVSFGYGVFASFRIASSIQKEIALLRQLPAAKGKSEFCRRNPDKAVSIARTAFLVLAVALTVYGFFTGGTMDVLTKAVNICTECIGLG